MGATPSQIENEVADPEDSESDDDEVIKIQHHRRYRVSLHYTFILNGVHKIYSIISKQFCVILVFIMQPPFPDSIHFVLS